MNQSDIEDAFQQGMFHMEELLAELLKVTDYEGGDGSEDVDEDATLSLINILTEAGLWNKDENCPRLTSLSRDNAVAVELLKQVTSHQWKPIPKTDMGCTHECSRCRHTTSGPETFRYGCTPGIDDGAKLSVEVANFIDRARSAIAELSAPQGEKKP